MLPSLWLVVTFYCVVMAEAVVVSSVDETEFRSSSGGNLTIRDWSWSQNDADAGRCMGSSACTCILHSWGFRFLTTGFLPPIERHDVATMVAEYDRARRPVDGTIAKEEWSALSDQMPPSNTLMLKEMFWMPLDESTVLKIDFAHC